MRVMVIVKASKESEAGQMPTEGILRKMTDYNEQLVNAGVMQMGRFEEVPLEHHLLTVQVNAFGVVNGTYAALPLLALYGLFGAIVPQLAQRLGG